jgi:ubiquinone/menaquinone biosynthesis C-methylase UbiE
MIDIENTNLNTKKAWADNWKDVSMENVLGIFEYPRAKKFFGLVEAFLPKNGIILEAGCGLGPWVIKLGMLGHDVIGIDYQEKCMHRIKAYDKTQKVCAADVRYIPFKEGSFSAYLSWGVIEHFAEGPDLVLKEAYRVLKKDGRLILAVPHNNIFKILKSPITSAQRNSFFRKLFKKSEKAYYYEKYFKVRELKDAISKQGFIIEKTMPADHIFTLLEFSNIFRNSKIYDGENALAVRCAKFLENRLPWRGAGSILIVAHK